jgi:glutamine amidotransferase
MVAVIDYGGANLASVLFALERLGVTPKLTKDAAEIRAADKVIFPGVGAAKSAMESLERFQLVTCIRELQQPVLGICLGMQLLFTRSEEGDAAMLDVIPEDIAHFPAKPGFSVPHMGWNTIKTETESPLLKGIDEHTHFYFVHSYYAPVTADYTLASCDYAVPFSAVVKNDNFYGCQFHPEKSSHAGEQLLKNFLREEL